MGMKGWRPWELSPDCSPWPPTQAQFGGWSAFTSPSCCQECSGAVGVETSLSEQLLLPWQPQSPSFQSPRTQAVQRGLRRQKGKEEAGDPKCRQEGVPHRGGMCHHRGPLRGLVSPLVHPSACRVPPRELSPQLRATRQEPAGLGSPAGRGLSP